MQVAKEGGDSRAGVPKNEEDPVGSVYKKSVSANQVANQRQSIAPGTSGSRRTKQILITFKN